MHDRRRLPPTEARRPHHDFGARAREIEAGLDHRRFQRVAATDQAFMQAVQAPEVVRVLAGAAERFSMLKYGLSVILVFIGFSIRMTKLFMLVKQRI